jgi:hypothetical protein
MPRDDFVQFNSKYIIMKFVLIVLIYCFGTLLVKAQNVGIGTTTPTEKLEVAGNIKSTNLLVTGYLGVNNTSPAYRMHINDGALGLTNTTDNVTWTLSYNTTNNYLSLAQNGATRMTFTNTGNVGIGTTAPANKLDVNGSLGASSAAIDGNLTVNNGFGVLRNGHSSTQLKYYTFTATFSFSNLNGHTGSGTHQINFPANADFTSAPRVLIGNYISIGGTEGNLLSLIPGVTSVTSTGFNISFFNSSTLQATMEFTLSFICIGN